MAIHSRSTIAGWFQRGLKPLAAQFGHWLDSFWHRNDLIPLSSVDGLPAILGNGAYVPLIRTVSANDTFTVPVNKTLWMIRIQPSVSSNISVTIDGVTFLDTTTIGAGGKFPLAVVAVDGQVVSIFGITATTDIFYYYA